LPLLSADGAKKITTGTRKIKAPSVNVKLID